MAPLAFLTLQDLPGFPSSTSSGPKTIAEGPLSFDSTQDSSVVALRIGDVVVKVQRGMQVAVGSGLGLGGNEGGTLTWCDMESNRILVLGLIGATTQDVLAIQRILLFQPPLPPPKPSALFTYSRTAPRPPSSTLPTTRTLGTLASSHEPNLKYRNSIILIDDSSREILAIRHLPKSHHPHHSHPSLPPSPPPVPVETRGEKLAHEVDRITHCLSGYEDRVRNRGGNPDCRGKEERQNGDQMAQHGGRTQDTVNQSGPTTPTVGGATTAQGYPMTHMFAILDRKEGGNLYLEDSVQESRMLPADPQEENLTISELLSSSLLMDTSSSSDTSKDYLDEAVSFSPAQSHISSSSNATIDTHLEHSRFISEFTSRPNSEYEDAVTISGETNYDTAMEEGSDSRRSSSATFESCWTELIHHREISIASDASTILAPSPVAIIDSPDLAPALDDQTTINPPPRPLSTLSQESDVSSNGSLLNNPLSPSYTGDAVLLRFLDRNSSIVAYNLTSEDARKKKLIQAGADDAGAWGWTRLFGLGNILGNLFGRERSDPYGGSWWNWWSSIPKDSGGSPDNSIAKSHRIQRKAGGEGTSRMSVLYFDDEGFGRKAYVEG